MASKPGRSTRLLECRRVLRFLVPSADRSFSVRQVAGRAVAALAVAHAVAPAGRFDRVQDGAAGRECRELGRPRSHGPEAGQWAEVEEDAVELGQGLGGEVDLEGKERERRCLAQGFWWVQCGNPGPKKKVSPK